VVDLVSGRDAAQVAFAEDHHLVGDFGPGGEDEPFGVGVRAGASRRDRQCLDTNAGQDHVEGIGELPDPVADQEPEVRNAAAEVHQQVADLLAGPRPVRVCGDPGDVYVAAADFDDEETARPHQGIAQRIYDDERDAPRATVTGVDRQPIRRNMSWAA
jgi:hypothetical protein